MKYLIIDSRYGFFVTKNAPRIVRRHLKEIRIPSGSSAWSNLMSIKNEEYAFCNHVLNILDSDFESGTNSFRILKQSLENNMTYAQALSVIAKIEYMMYETIPYALLNCSELINKASGMRFHNEKTFSSFRIGTDAVACGANIGCVFGGYKIIEYCDAIMAELDREQNEYRWVRTPYEEQWYRWAKSTRDKMSECFNKALGGVLCNGVKVAVNSVDAINAADGKTL